MVKIRGTTITATRGDTIVIQIGINNADGTPYEPTQGDEVRFAMKKDYKDKNPIMVKNVDVGDLLLTLLPEDTKPLEFGDYVYDVQLTRADGAVDTFIAKGSLKITEEVD